MSKIKIEKTEKGTVLEVKGKRREVTDLLIDSLQQSKEFQHLIGDALYVFMGVELAKHGIDIRDLFKEISRKTGIPMQEPEAPEPEPEEETVMPKKKKERIIN